jgi:hypothetical protein
MQVPPSSTTRKITCLSGRAWLSRTLERSGFPHNYSQARIVWQRFTNDSAGAQDPVTQDGIWRRANGMGQTARQKTMGSHKREICARQMSC